MALQMTWQSNFHHRRKNAPPLGLKNLGNTCYLNSVLQCLTYTPPLANFCLKNQHSSLCDSTSEADRKRDCPFCILEKRIVRSLSIDLPLDSPSKIQNCLRIFSEHFRSGRQEDAHEFLRYVIDACHNTCLRLKKLQKLQCRKGDESCNGASNGGGGSGFGGDTIVKEIFGGALQNQVKCLSCGAESNKTDEIMDISLDLFQINSLKYAMQRFFQAEILDGSNKYKCEKCKKLVAARKQMSILKAPNILVVQLKRFEGIHGGKIDRSIAFEDVLVLSSYMCKASQKTSFRQRRIPSTPAVMEDPCPEYNLFGTIVHSGYSPESGHYYAYIKDAIGRWYCCNDSHVSLSTLQEVLSEKVYILFFSRTNQRPKPTKSAFASNGVKSPNCNGSDAIGSPKAALPLKTLPTKLKSINSQDNNISTTFKIDKVPSSPRIKFGILRNPDIKRIISNGGPVEKHVGLKESLGVDRSKNEVSSTIDRNGANENGCPDSEGKCSLSLPHQNGEIQCTNDSSVKTVVCENNDAGNLGTLGMLPNFDCAVCNDNDHRLPELSGSKRKSVEETCILLAQDASSQAKLEKFKEVLAKDASSSLRSCGWHDMVYHFMQERKRLCVREAGNCTSNPEIKKMLIVDAKENFLLQIPELLKEHLVECLRSFSKEK